MHKRLFLAVSRFSIMYNYRVKERNIIWQKVSPPDGTLGEQRLNCVTERKYHHVNSSTQVERYQSSFQAMSTQPCSAIDLHQMKTLHIYSYKYKISCECVNRCLVAFKTLTISTVHHVNKQKAQNITGLEQPC